MGSGNTKPKIIHVTEKVDHVNEKVDHVTEKVDQVNEKVDHVTEKDDHVIEKINRKTETDNVTKKTKIDLDETNEYEKIDQHARKATEDLKNSAEELVQYLSSVSKDPRMLTRGIFIWITENIKYDVEGYFGRSARAPTDAESVLKHGKSVCAGYANVFELLCRKAEIPVKTISGFAKGFGYSPTEQLTLKGKTNHAWNAVQLLGKWYLLDSTWAAGNVDGTSKKFRKKLNEFYFLTDPKHFITDHFPYMDNNLIESQKWQLLPKPASIEEFSSNIKYSDHAFRIGVQAVSHTKAYFHMKRETQMTFRSVNKEDVMFSAKLTFKRGNSLSDQSDTTFYYRENNIYKILVHPRKIGMHQLNIFCKRVSDDKQEGIPYMMRYDINCTEVKDITHKYPIIYKTAIVEKCILHEPMRGNLPENTLIQFCISSPILQYIVINRVYYEKHGAMFTCPVMTPDKGNDINIFGTAGDRGSKRTCLYKFHTV